LIKDQCALRFDSYRPHSILRSGSGDSQFRTRFNWRPLSFPTAMKRPETKPLLDLYEPWYGLCRQIAAGGLRCPDLTQRHQALFSLVASCVSVAWSQSQSGPWSLLPRCHQRLLRRGMGKGASTRRSVLSVFDPSCPDFLSAQFLFDNKVIRPALPISVELRGCCAEAAKFTFVHFAGTKSPISA
jgi:hypothetical protein